MQHLIGVNTNTYHGFSVDEALEGIAAAGFEYVELAAVRGWTPHIMPDMADAELDRIAAKMRALGLSCIAVSGHCNLTDEARLNDFRANMKLARRFGAEYIISSTGEAHHGHDETFSDEVLIQNIKQLLPDLQENGLRLGIEVHGEYGTGEKIARLVKGVGSPLVGINFDTANVVFYGGKRPLDDLATCLEQVNFIHLKDKIGIDNSWNFPAIGQGELDLANLIRTLRARGCHVPMSIEIEYTQDYTMRDKVPSDLEAANRAVRESYQFLKAEGLI